MYSTSPIVTACRSVRSVFCRRSTAVSKSSRAATRSVATASIVFAGLRAPHAILHQAAFVSVAPDLQLSINAIVISSSCQHCHWTGPAENAPQHAAQAHGTQVQPVAPPQFGDGRARQLGGGGTTRIGKVTHSQLRLQLPQDCTAAVASIASSAVAAAQQVAAELADEAAVCAAQATKAVVKKGMVQALATLTKKITGERSKPQVCGRYVCWPYPKNPYDSIGEVGDRLSSGYS